MEAAAAAFRCSRLSRASREARGPGRRALDDSHVDVGRVGDDVEHGGALLRLGHQRLDLCLAGVGVDLERDADVAEAVPDLLKEAS